MIFFRTVATNVFEEIGIFFNSVNSRKNVQQMEKIDKIYKPQTWGKKRKKDTGIEVDICVHSK